MGNTSSERISYQRLCAGWWLLPDAGRVTHEQAVEKALTEYDKFRVIQDREIMSDFDKQLKLLFDNKKQDGKEWYVHKM